MTNCLRLAACLLLAVSAGSAEQLVVRDLLTGTAPNWAAGPWDTAPSRSSATNDRPAGAAGPAVELTVAYTGGGFEHVTLAPPFGPIPGRIRRLSVWAKALAADYAWIVSFQDAEGKDTVGGKKLEWGLRTVPSQWVKLDFTVPADWPQPLKLAGLTGHNWEKQNAKAEASVRLAGFTVETDIDGITDPAKLVSLSATTGVPSNLFQPDAPVRYTVVCDSWLGKELSGTLAYELRDAEGKVVGSESRPLAMRDTQTVPLDLKPPGFGAYRLRLSAKLGDVSFERQSRFAYTPAPPKQTWEQKVAGPYGLNIHGGLAGIDYRGIARMGFTWVRDYAYSFEWMTRARGADSRYAGWPYYNKLDAAVQDAGLVLLPCLMGGIGQPVKGGRLAPDKAWRSDILPILLRFPQYVAWELDNEYDYHSGREEEARGWSSYDAYHRGFAQVLKVVDDKTLAVAQGQAGVHPDWVRRSVANHSFDQIDVVNAHVYTGTKPPEIVTENANVGQEGEAPGLLYDVFRDFVSASRSDGKQRQTWLTEFGWDTLAGYIVNEKEQAAYLQRGYALGLQAGLDKMFWYWQRDTKDKPKQYFDGCGLLDPADEPKPAAAAIAALTAFLPHPTPVGRCAPAPGAMGHVFRSADQIVAMVFRVEPEAAAPTVDLPNGKLFDMWGNPLTERRQKLDITPVWIVGLPETDALYRQAAYDLATPGFMRVTAGDPLTIETKVTNNRTTALAATLAVNAPKGWTATAAPAVSLAPGATQTAPVTVTIDPREPAGQSAVMIDITENGLKHRLTTLVEVAAAANLSVSPLSGAPGAAKVEVAVRNNRRRPASFELTSVLPANWKIEPAKATVADIAPGATAKTTFTVTWTPSWTTGEQALIKVATPEGQVVSSAGLRPGTLSIPRVDAPKLDGNPAGWPAAAKLPDWAMGRVGSGTKGDVWLGWTPDGLWVACRVDPSPVTVTDPRAFWAQDCLELFVDTANSKAERAKYVPGDHQFWLCPLVGEKRAYLGQWQRGTEIEATHWDIQGIRSFAGRSGGGYVMEALIPAAQIKGFAGQAGRKLGLCANLSVPGDTGRGELYWPLDKAGGVAEKPALWGTVELR
ncbi:MAG: hypothetical protein HZB16_14505 [Armatimonadetes bacterium]|nr:hypothetical protein [Armatimonadota bacterium]